MSETSDYQEELRRLKEQREKNDKELRALTAKREEIEREFPIEKVAPVKKITRLDALKAHLPSINYPLVTLKQISRLVAVVEAVLRHPEFMMCHEDLDEALDYWLEEE